MIFYPNDKGKSLYECFVVHLQSSEGGTIMFPLDQFSDADQRTLDAIERLLIAGGIRLYHHQGKAFLLLTERAEQAMAEYVNDPELN